MRPKRPVIYSLMVMAVAIPVGFGPLSTAHASEHVSGKAKPLTANQVCATKPTFSAGGAWTCFAKPKYQLGSGKANIAKAAAVPAAAQSTEFCDSSGYNNCWVRNSATKALFNGGTIPFGAVVDGETIDIGFATLNAGWSISGTKISEAGAFYARTVELTNIQWLGALFNGAARVNDNGGDQIAACEHLAPGLNVAVGSHTDSPEGWCTTSDNKSFDHNMLIGVIWGTPGYDLQWDAWATSIVSHSPTVPATAYTFDSADSLPLEAWGGGGGGSFP